MNRLYNNERRCTMKRKFGFGLIAILVFAAFSTATMAGGDAIRVMTRNQYVGADIPRLILVPPENFFSELEDVFALIAANNFPLRARRLAAEVAFTRPDLIGLQEFYDFKINGVNIGPPFVDHLTETLTALDDLGQKYVVAATVINLDITIPIDIDGNVVSVLDRDVILAREGVWFEKLDGDVSDDGLCGVTVKNPLPEQIQETLMFPEDLKSTISEDGCNYAAVAKVNTPVGSITIQRGFVGVDARMRGKKIRFVNTHLEVQILVPNQPLTAAFQSLQALELRAALEKTTPPGRKLVLVGDFNSSPDHMQLSPLETPYQIIVDAGYTDIWDKNYLKFINPNGYTCCQLEDLSNTVSLLYERIDHIFVRHEKIKSLAFVTGQVPIYPLWFSPNWASDHGGVFGKIQFKRNYRKMRKYW